MKSEENKTCICLFCILFWYNCRYKNSKYFLLSVIVDTDPNTIVDTDFNAVINTDFNAVVDTNSYNLEIIVVLVMFFFYEILETFPILVEYLQ
jgi:hypothetical protein